MLDQGYDLETQIREDNRSTILLIKNGKLSSGKRAKHFDIRYKWERLGARWTSDPISLSNTLVRVGP
jgi:hypothetical protein